MSMSWSSLSRAVIVGAHAVYVAGDPWDDRSWVLKPGQAGEPPMFVHHLLRGIELTAADPRAGCIYSGGQTEAATGAVSEGQGYWRIAQSVRWLGRPDVQDRAATENFARDSFENLLFGLCRFRELAGHFPEHLTMVSWKFKEARFALHREAIRWPPSRWTYVGVNDPIDLATAVSGERQTLQAFRRDPYGTTGVLAGKRRSRNPYHRHPPYSATCPEIADLLRHPGSQAFDLDLPWTTPDTSTSGADTAS